MILQNAHRYTISGYHQNPINLPTNKPWESILYPITTPLQERYRSVTF